MQHNTRVLTSTLATHLHAIRDALAGSSGLPNDGDDDGRDRQSADRTPNARLGARLAAPDERQKRNDHRENQFDGDLGVIPCLPAAVGGGDSHLGQADQERTRHQLGECSMHTKGVDPRSVDFIWTRNQPATLARPVE